MSDLLGELPFISSANNPRIKALARLRERKERVKLGEFGVEGAREIARAVRCGYEVRELFICSPLISDAARELLASLSEKPSRPKLFTVSETAFAKIAMREGSDGLWAVMTGKEVSLAELAFKASSHGPLLLIVEDVEKPGNLGALLRSADGAGADAVIVLSGSVDPFNPNVIRASIGTVFSVPVVRADNESALAFCRAHGIAILAATPHAKDYYTSSDLRRPVAIVLGSEADGLSPFWLKEADLPVKIPMCGVADSLNVSVAGSVLLYEACRQRFAEA